MPIPKTDSESLFSASLCFELRTSAPWGASTFKIRHFCAFWPPLSR